jgi:hypothetical protein
LQSCGGYVLNDIVAQDVGTLRTDLQLRVFEAPANGGPDTARINLDANGRDVLNEKRDGFVFEVDRGVGSRR